MKKVMVVCAMCTILALSTAIQANTVASSTMVFEGDLTANGDGSYTGNIMGIANFDVFAKIGSTVVSPVSSINGLAVGADHDAYPNWDPDIPDVIGQGSISGGYYALHLDGSAWELWYLATPNDPDSGPASSGGIDYIPFAGSVNWGTGIATEAGQNWEQTWSGTTYENIQLQSADFDISASLVSGCTYQVTMAPIPEPATFCLLGLGGFLLRRKRRV